jgi:hypothetical protein
VHTRARDPLIFIILLSAHLSFFVQRFDDFYNLKFFCFLLFADIYDYSNIVFPTDSDGGILIPTVMRPKGTLRIW